VQDKEQSAAWWWKGEGVLRRVCILEKVEGIIVEAERAVMERARASATIVASHGKGCVRR
jgi:hypothetical protein